MAKAKKGDNVKVHYTGKLDDGTVFDSSVNREPLEFTMGGGQIIPGFEEAVTDMEPGDSKTTTIPADMAYGPHREEMVLVVNRAELPAELDLDVGQQLQSRQPDGQTMLFTVTELSDSSVTLDANHPLAGMDLTFDIQLVEIA